MKIEDVYIYLEEYEQKKQNNEPFDEEEFLSGLHNVIRSIDSNIKDNQTVIGYTGKINGVEAWRIAEAVTELNPDTIFISKFEPGKLLSKPIIELIRDKLGTILGPDKVEQIIGGYYATGKVDENGREIWKRDGAYSGIGNLPPLDDVVSEQLMSTPNASSNLIILAAEEIDDNKVFAVTEANTLNSNDRFETINGVNKTKMAALYNTGREGHERYKEIINITPGLAVPEQNLTDSQKEIINKYFYNPDKLTDEEREFAKNHYETIANQVNNAINGGSLSRKSTPTNLRYMIDKQKYVFEVEKKIVFEVIDYIDTIENVNSETTTNLTENDILHDLSDIELYNKYLKFQGNNHTFPQEIMLACFSANHNAAFVRSKAQWELADCIIKPDAQGTLCKNKEGKEIEMFDISQIESGTLPDIKVIGPDDVSVLKSKLNIPENESVTDSLIGKYMNADIIQDNISKFMKRINADENFTDQFIQSVKGMISSKLSEDNVYYFNNADNSFFCSLTNENKKLFLALARYASSQIIKEIDDAINQNRELFLQNSNNKEKLFIVTNNLLNTLGDDPDIYNAYLKFQGTIFRQTTSVAMELFSQKPDAQFIGSREEWLKFGYEIKLGEDGIKCVDSAGEIREFFDFSQIDSDVPPSVPVVNTENVSDVKRIMDISDKSTLIDGLIAEYVRKEVIIDAMKELKVPAKHAFDFAAMYAGTLKTIAAGRLELGGNKFNITANCSYYSRLDSEQKLNFLEMCSERIRIKLLKLENAIRQVNQERRIKNADTRNMDEHDAGRETERTGRSISGSSEGRTEERSDIFKTGSERPQTDVGNHKENVEGRRDSLVSGTEGENDTRRKISLQTRSDNGNIQYDSSESGAVTEGGTGRNIRSEVDEVHAGELSESGGTSENGTQISDSSENGGRRSSGLRGTSGQTVRGNQSETAQFRGNMELGEGEEILFGISSNEGNSTGSENRLTGREEGEEQRQNVNNTESEKNNESYYDDDDHSDDQLTEIIYADNPAERANDNIAALRMLSIIEKYNMTPTNAQKETLRKYVGWGGLAQVFDDRDNSYAYIRNSLKTLISDAEYESAKASTLNAHYTPQNVIDAMYKAVRNMDLPRDARILEPACGTGNFITRLPSAFSEANIVGVELDSVTARIAAALNTENDNVTVINSAFEKSGLENNSFDLAIGNVPFGNYNMTDPDYSQNWKIHDAFIRKALDKVAPGGVVAFITSTGTLDKRNPKVREYLSEKSDLIGAVRLPNNTFTNAGTRTATDIIFLQKRGEPRLNGEYPDWCYTVNNEDGLRINSYFVQNPKMLLGKMEQTSHFNMLTCSPIPGASLENQLDEAIRSLNAKITVQKREEAVKKRQSVIEPWGRNFTYQKNENGIYYREGNTMLTNEFSKSEEAKVSLLIDIRDAARELVELQSTPVNDDQLKPCREKLNQLYDEFVEKYGHFKNNKIFRKFNKDIDSSLVKSLESYDEDTKQFSKAEIFTRRTVNPGIQISEADNLEDAMQISMDRRGNLDIEYMAQLLKKIYTMENSADVIVKELLEKGYAFNDPAEIIADKPYSGITEAAEYLSGNVRQKLSIAEEYAIINKEFERNVNALKEVIPERITAEEISVQMGCAWIDAEDYTKFLETLSERKSGNQRNCDVTYSVTSGEFTVNNARSKADLNINENTTYGTENYSLYSLAEKILNQRRITVKRDYPDPADPSKKVTKTDVKATKLANEKARLIKDKFREWIFADDDRKEKYEERYNNIFNSLAGRNYDGTHLSFPGMDSDWTLRQHQKDCVARTIYGGNTLAAHAVGAGKSAIIISSVMKKKDIGLINKACVVVPKPLLEQTELEWLRLYPNAKLLAVNNNDLKTEERRKLFTARVATGSYDAVIMSQEQFEKLAMSKEYRLEYIRNQLDMLEDYLKDFAQNNKHQSVKNIEQQKKKLEEKLYKITNPASASKAKDDLLEFENLGFDYLVVDEAHAYKNGFVMTKMSDVAGVTTRASGRAEDMQMKTDYFNEKLGKGHILFATGTPVSNSMTELYVMTRYLRPDILRAAGVNKFDDWAATFGNVVTKNQQGADGRLKLKSKFASFNNLPELMTMYKEFADIMSSDKLDLPRPKLKDNKVQIVRAEATKEQKAYVKQLAKRSEKYESGLVESSVDNMLKITNEARLVGLGNMVVKSLYEKRGESLPDDFIVEKNSKVDLCIKKVADIYERTKDTKGVQIIFSDIAVNSDNGNVSVYDYIKNELVNEYNIPENEIVFGPKSEARNRDQIFKDINNSKYRVVIASTNTLGTGANIQKNLYALHHVDIPWKPSDFTQREGRILRQGNTNPEVEIYNYITESTLDSYLYQTVTDKARFIAQLLDNDSPARVSEDCDEKVLTFAEIQAAAEGNPDFRKRIELSNEISELTMLRNEYIHETKMTKKNMSVMPQRIDAVKEKIAANSTDVSAARTVSENDFKITAESGRIISDGKEINSYLSGLVQNKIQNPNGRVPVFRVGDFEVKVKGMYSVLEGNKVEFEVNGKLTYTAEASGESTADNRTRLSNIFAKSIPNKSEELKKSLTEWEENLQQAEKRIEEPFPNEEKLNNLVQEFNELEERLIRLSEGGNEFTDSDEPGVIEDTNENTDSSTIDEPEDDFDDYPVI